MPLPLIPVLIGGASLVTAAFGAKKGYDAYQDSKSANEYHEDAKKKYNDAEELLNHAKELAHEQFNQLGELQIEIIQNDFPKILAALKHINASMAQDLSSVSVEGPYDLKGLDSVRELLATLQTSVSGVAAGSVAGALAGFGAYGSAGLLASASTGTAISTLSGAAATKATLAWFGGGSLASGGLGMAGGTLILGGMVAAPVIAVAATVFALSAEKKKYDAQAYYESVCAVCHAIDAEILAWKDMQHKAEEKTQALHLLRKTLKEQIEYYNTHIVIKDKSAYTDSDKNLTRLIIKDADSLGELIKQPLMNDEDPLTQRIKQHQEECKKLMDEIEEKWGEK